MKDLVFVGLTAVFFLLSWLYVRPASGSEGGMSLEYVVGLLLSVLLLGAISCYALLKPERF